MHLMDNEPWLAVDPKAIPPLPSRTAVVYRGKAFGALVDAEGESVFTTTMTGYQQVCTDPSFRRQIVCMTYPLIGNYGVNAHDDESRRPWIAGLVVREVCDSTEQLALTGNAQRLSEAPTVFPASPESTPGR